MGSAETIELPCENAPLCSLPHGHRGQCEAICEKPIRGFYGVWTTCARPKGHWGGHWPVKLTQDRDRL